MYDIIVPLVISLVVGIVLLLFEYRTHWFANRKSSKTKGKPTITAHNVTSREGAISIDDSTGRGLDAKSLDAKKDVKLTSDSKSNPSDLPLDNLINTAGRVFDSMNLSAERMLAAGNITIQQFVNSQGQREQQLEFFEKDIGVTRTARNSYLDSQFAAYCEVWKTLQALRLAGDDLWEKANTENVVRFVNELRNATLVVNERAIFFEEEDRQELISLLRSLGNYRLEKLKLIEIRTEQQIKYYSKEEIQRQIEKNRVHKEEYENLLDKIRISFKRRLSTV